MKLFLSVFFLFVFGTVLFAQTTITGYVKDAKTGSPLNGVDVVVVGKPFGTVTNT